MSIPALPFMGLALLALCHVLLAPSARAVDMEDLWVPKSYIRHLPRLYDAAERVEQFPSCAELLEGTTHLGRTTEAHAVFTIKCRSPEGESFSLMVDGLTLKKVDDTRPGGLVSFEQLRREYEQAREREREQGRKEQELARLREQRAAVERERQQWLQWWEEEYRRREDIWQRCVRQLRERVGGMQALEWLTRTMPEPEMAHEPTLDAHPPLRFTIDFNAESYYGEPLYYRAHCQQSSEDEGAEDEGAEGGDAEGEDAEGEDAEGEGSEAVSLDIDPRRDDAAASASEAP